MCCWRDVGRNKLGEEAGICPWLNNDTMEEDWSQQGWNLLFRRALNDCEIKEVAKLLEVLNDFLGKHVLLMRPYRKDACQFVQGDVEDYFGPSEELEAEGKRKNGGSSSQHVAIGPYDADPGYLCLHRHKMQANWHQYIECTSMRAGKLNHNLSLKRVQQNTYLGSVQLMNN
ncbi:hypothetical protein MTR67_048105 [Solanum verrucosum]|uniref:Uncharacterized protein n=1 Tax=Solanum verrucosum TaxID=315347 RepID=A0AAF0UZ00_SOLVR|nr:hypothetical protein MTR67_048105 [Solanum verrucosum]